MPTQRPLAAKRDREHDGNAAAGRSTEPDRVRRPKLLEHEPLPAMTLEERSRLLEAACELAAAQLRFRFTGVTVPRDDQAPLPESSRALIRRLARESRERRRG